MMRSIADLAVRRGRAVLASALLLVPVLVALGGDVETHMTVGGFVSPGAESTQVAHQLETEFGAGSYDYVLLAEPGTGRVTDDANVLAGLVLSERVRSVDGVVEVAAPWIPGAPPPTTGHPLVSDDGTRALLAVRLGGDEDARRATAERLDRSIVQPSADGAQRLGLTATGPSEVSRQAADQAERDLLRAEILAAPLTLIGLLLVFRGLRAALLPLAVAALAVLATFSILRVITEVTSVSVFALNLTAGLGLGLAIDYSLLMVTRFREERADGRPVDDAVRATVDTAGRTVLVSAVTVALSLGALVLFPVAYLRSFALAGAVVVTCASAAALLVVPAALARFGDRLGAEPAGRRRQDRFWFGQAHRVMRRPALWALGAVTLLAVAGVPFLGVDPGRIDHRTLPTDATAYRAAEQIIEHVSYPELHPVTVLTPWIEPGDFPAVSSFSRRLLDVPGVVRVDSAGGSDTGGAIAPPTASSARFHGASGSGTWFSVVLGSDPDHTEAEDAVRRIRDLHPDVAVGGTTATALDDVDGVTHRLPLALAMIAATTFVLLFVMTGSVVVPVKALVLNVLSLSATFGALVWVFQDGHLAGLLGVTPTGHLDVFTPLLMFCIAFGLSMDYEVFLLARIKEHHDRYGDGVASVAHGLGHTGRLLTSATVLLTTVFVSIATSGVASVKMLGFGLAVAVLVDAFVVRATLVPAVMRLAGETNWWAPAPLRRLHERLGVRESANRPHPDEACRLRIPTHTG